MKCLSLFSGAGGGDLAHQHLLGFETVGYVEWGTYCQQVLAQRIKDGFLDEAPIFGDIDEFIESGAAKKYAGFVDVVTAGFPCQPFSVAGKKKGQDDERNKWPQTLQCIRDVRPRYAFLENVPGLINSGYFGEILSSLAQAGYDARWIVLGADDVDAPHRRKRLWILADSNSNGWGAHHLIEGGGRKGERTDRGERQIIGSSSDLADTESGKDHERKLRHMDEKTSGRKSRDTPVKFGSSDVADSDSTGLSQRRWTESVEKEYTTAECGSEGQSQSSWPAEPELGRVAYGVASRVDRLKALGNGQVPQCTALAWKILNDCKGE